MTTKQCNGVTHSQFESIPLSRSLFSETMQDIFSDNNVGTIVARFLKPSDIRALVVALQFQGIPVSGYFELLCRSLLKESEFKQIISEYLGTLNLHKRPKFSHHWSLRPSQKTCEPTSDAVSQEVHFLGTTFKRNIDDTTTEGLPYELIYKIELFGRYCDECAVCLNDIQLIKPHLIKVPYQEIRMKGCESVEHKEACTPFSEEGHSPDNKMTNSSSDQYRIVDESLAKVVLCDECVLRFVSRDSLLPVLHHIFSSPTTMEAVGYITPINADCISFDHAGSLILKSKWNHFYDQFTRTYNHFKNIYRQGFVKRMGRLFGQCFYHQFIYKILPCDRFLEIDAKQRSYNPIPWVSRSSGCSKRKSRFKNGPNIDRYPLGSLERSTAYQIAEDFTQWSSTDSIDVLFSAESRITQVFLLASNVLHHPDYQKAASTVEDFVLTRQIHRDAFEKIYLPSLWRVLYRGGTLEQRRFTGCMYDRQRIDKFFSACCASPKPPVLPVKGYLGFEENPEGSEDRSSWILCQTEHIVSVPS